MNKFLKLMLANTLLVTSGMATTTIEGETRTVSTIGDKLTIDSGSVEQINSSVVIYAPDGEIELKGSDMTPSKLIVSQHKIIELRGGKIIYDGEGEVKPQISLDGELRLVMEKEDENIIYPTLNLPDVKIEGHWRHFDSANDINTDYVTLTIGDTIADNGGDISFATDSSNKKYINNKNNAYMYLAILNSQLSIPKNSEQSIELEIKTETGTESKTVKYTINDNHNITIDNKEIEFSSNYVVYEPILSDDSKYKHIHVYIIENKSLFDVYFADTKDALIFGGTINMLNLREEPTDISNLSDLRTPFELSTINLNTSPTIWAVGLPFNCKFNTLDLSNIIGHPIKDETQIAIANGGIYYTILKETVNAPGIKKYNTLENVIGKINEEHTYGDYLNDLSLGVKITDPNQVCAVTKEKLTSEQLVLSHEYKTLGVTSESSKQYYLDTNDLDVAHQDISADTDYGFAFIGEKAISISSTEDNYKAIFSGDNTLYNPIDNSLTLPTEVEFAGNNSLFPITQTYTHGTFSTGIGETKLSNKIPEDKNVTFTNGLDLEKGHSLTVKGTLVL